MYQLITFTKIRIKINNKQTKKLPMGNQPSQFLGDTPVEKWNF